MSNILLDSLKIFYEKPENKQKLLDILNKECLRKDRVVTLTIS